MVKTGRGLDCLAQSDYPGYCPFTWSARMDDVQVDEKQIFSRVIDLLHRLAPEARYRVLRAAEVFFDIPAPSASRASDDRPQHVIRVHGDARQPSFGDRQDMSAKDFLAQKEPATDVDRVACLAYYLTHFRGVKHFKTVDISALNTEAAQLKFSNAAFAVTNAHNAGLIVSAGKGQKQLSALGERYIDALPDREAARQVMKKMRGRSRRRKSKRADEPASS
jgi:hypothetical protein